eukprot:2539174-Lingulodinium_polyedra.AAC.1
MECTSVRFAAVDGRLELLGCCLDAAWVLLQCCLMLRECCCGDGWVLCGCCLGAAGAPLGRCLGAAC